MNLPNAHQQAFTHQQAFAKIILFGEHAVIYGYPCIVAAVNRTISAHISISDEGRDNINAPGVSNTNFPETTVEIFKNTFSLHQNIQVSTHTDFTTNEGIGSSSASIIAILKALNDFFQTHMTELEIFSMGMNIVHQVQKSGSGVDLVAALYGGTMWYERKDPIETSKIETIDCQLNDFYIANSSVKASTATYIEKVQDLMKIDSHRTKHIFQEIGDLTIEAKSELKNNNRLKLGNLMLQNHELLKRLQVSTPQLDTMVDVVMNEGAYGAKLSGAGGGDNIIFIAEDKNIEKIRHALQRYNVTILDVKCGTKKYEKIHNGNDVDNKMNV